MATVASERRNPKVFEFSDYRAYLVAHFEDRKRSNPLWSYQAWAKRLGLKNNTSLLKIVHGTREAGPEITDRLMEYFRFQGSERAYFQDLVRLSKAKADPALQVSIMERLRKVHPRREFEFLDEKRFSAIAHWWFYAIRQLAKRDDFEWDAETIARSFTFPVQPRQIEQALETLRKLGLLLQDPETGKWRPSPRGLTTSDDVSSEALRRFHEGVLSIAQDSIRKVPVAERELSGITLMVDEADLPRAKEFLRRMETEFCAQFGDPKQGNRVYQLEVAFFPLSKTLKRKDEIYEI